MAPDRSDFRISCPIPLSDYPKVLLAHGGGGRLMRQLIEKMFLPAFENPTLRTLHDGALLEVGHGRLAFTTDSYVVRPLWFPGGDIGTLAINGTVNDLAMCGARPLYLSAGLILEEGFPMDRLWRVVQSMQGAAEAAGVQLVTGDTKVVDRGKGDGVFINTAGVGLVEHDLQVGPQSVRPGDAILLNGDIGRHGIAVMAQREGLAFESPIESDCASLAGQVQALLDGGVEIHCLRDLTRGGLAGALIEISESAGLAIRIRETGIPVRREVQAACELLGLDPLYVANEGRFVSFVPAEQSDQALEVLRDNPLGDQATPRVIGSVGEPDGSGAGRPLVTLTTPIGTQRIVDMLSGEQLPRIC